MEMFAIIPIITIMPIMTIIPIITIMPIMTTSAGVGELLLGRQQ